MNALRQGGVMFFENHPISDGRFEVVLQCEQRVLFCDVLTSGG